MTADQQDRMGELIREGDQIGLRYVRRLAHPRERVWRALTESDQLLAWLPCDIVGERREGAEVELPFWPDHVTAYGDRIDEPLLHGKILTWRPPELFEWTWDTDFLRWELTEEGDGTVLTFTTWIGDPSAEDASGTAAGYHVCLDQLEDLLSGGPAQRLVDVDVAPWVERYAQRFAG